MRFKLLLILLLCIFNHARAQEDNLKMRLDFENASGAGYFLWTFSALSCFYRNVFWKSCLRT